MPRALLHMHRAPELPHAIPLLHVLQQTGGWQVMVNRTPWDAATRTGLPPVYEERLFRLGVEVVASDARPDVDVLFTYGVNELTPECAKYTVQLPSSLIAKGLRYAGGTSAEADNLADLLLVPGQWHESRMARSKRVFVPTVAIGMPSLDPLFGGWVAKRDHLREQLKLAPGQKAILYAPTWNPELSSVPLLWTRIRSLATPQNVVILRPHPYLPDEYLRACEELTITDANIRLAREPDLQPYLQVADLVISDTSSVAWEAALLDTSVIRIDTPNRSEYKHLDHSDPEYQFSDFGPIVRSFDELRDAVQTQLANPAQFHEARMHLREPLLASTNGTSCQQVLAATLDLLGGGSSVGRVENAGICVVLDARSATEATVERSLEPILDHGREHVQVRLIRGDRLEATAIERWRNRWTSRLTIATDSHSAISSELPFLLMMRAGVFGTAGWLFRLTNHLRRHKGLIAVAPMAIGGRPVQEPHIRIQQTESSAITFEDIDHWVRFKQAGELLDPGQAPAADAILLRKRSPLFATLSERWLSNQWAEPAEKVPVGIAADVVVHFSTRKLTFDSTPSLNGQRSAAEERVRELSQWIQRSMPGHVRQTPSSSSVKTSPPLAELPGPLRLATHYLEQGKLGRATQMIERARMEFPDHPQTLALMERLGITNTTSMTSGSEAQS